MIYITRGGKPKNTSLLTRYVAMAGGSAYIRPFRQCGDFFNISLIITKSRLRCFTDQVMTKWIAFILSESNRKCLDHANGRQPLSSSN